jgi:hypothetical protein
VIYARKKDGQAVEQQEKAIKSDAGTTAFSIAPASVAYFPDRRTRRVCFQHVSFSVKSIAKI